ncbi:hypothetical protein AB0I95_15205 [Micromonospora sp. NPDC049751]|uniref:hypothetical protein n=1 Tax=Micromonospora sp. NPDC049751 TaxID=3154837 RepID=UPI00340E8631
MSVPEQAEATQLKDILGQVIEPGDQVIYPQMSGRSVQMVLGKLISYNGKTASIARTGGSRWEASYNRTRYRDKRTGKGIDIWAGNGKHWEVEPGSIYTHPETGEVLTQEELDERHPLSVTWSAYSYRGENDAAWAARYRYVRSYRQGVHKDYVEKYRDAPKPVTIQNVRNIVKVTAQ